MRAIWKDQIIAESDETIVVEGNHYFPQHSVKKEYFIESDTTTYCPWKGHAHYFTLSIEGEENKDAAWYYPETKDKAKSIEGYIAFWNGVNIEEE